jgi:hypothetical protein
MGANEEDRTPQPGTPVDEFRCSVEAARELLDSGQLLIFVPASGGIRFEAEDAALEQAAERHGIKGDQFRTALQREIPDLLWFAVLEAPEEVVQEYLGRGDTDSDKGLRVELAERYALVTERLLTDETRRYARSKTRDEGTALSDVRWTVLKPASPPEARPIARLLLKTQRGGWGLAPPPGGVGPPGELLGGLLGRPPSHTEMYCCLEDVAYLIRQLEALRAELVAASTKEGE